jgi:ABC-2 type transport system ATP-binding protein
VSVSSGPSKNSKIIEVQDLHKSYGPLKAVDGVSFSVKTGEVFGILGPNGAGKTTTVEILEGMRPPDRGIALVNGIDVQKDPRGIKSVIGIQLQSSAFFDKLNLSEILGVFGSLYRRRVDPLPILQQVELEDKAKSLFKNLSGGQKQRLSIAIALVNDPLVLFLDEPTTGLDPQARRHMWELIKQFRAEGRTILLTTHYMEEAEELCDRVAIMDHGRIIALDRPETLIDDLLDRGFHKEHVEKLANLEDVFLDLTGHALREA